MFELTKSQMQIKKAVKDFTKGEFKKEIVDALIKNCSFPDKIWKKAANLGFIGIHFPESYSGEGLGVFENTLIAEELCRADSTIGFCLTRAGHGAELLVHFGNEDQKSNWLPKVAEATVLSSGAFSEPGSGHNVAGTQTTAHKIGEHWVVNGTKNFVINAGAQSGVYIVLCRTDESSEEQNGKLSLFLIESDRKGITVNDVGKRLGCRLSSIAEVCFDDVRIPKSSLIGMENKGLKLVTAYFTESRILSAAQSLGIAQGAFERAFSYVKGREQFGRKIVDFQVTRHKLAEMHTKIEASRLLTYQAALSFDSKKAKNVSKMSAMAKLFACRAAVEVCDEAIQLLGGYGYIQEYEVERYFRDAKMVEMLEGVRGFQKETIMDGLS